MTYLKLFIRPLYGDGPLSAVLVRFPVVVRRRRHLDNTTVKIRIRWGKYMYNLF